MAKEDNLSKIERKEVGGKVVIDFFNNDDLHHLLQILEGQGKMDGFAQKLKENLKQDSNYSSPEVVAVKTENVSNTDLNNASTDTVSLESDETKDQMIQDLIEDDSDVGVTERGTPVDDSSPSDKNEDDEDLYSIKNFSL